MKTYTLPSGIASIKADNAEKPVEGRISIKYPTGHIAVADALREALMELVRLNGEEERTS